MIKYALFDWDGTLADTYGVLIKAYESTFEKLGLKKISADEIKQISATAQNRDVLSHLYGHQALKAKEIFYAYIDAYHLKGLKPIDGARELLDFCVQNGIEPRLITNKSEKYIFEELAFLGFEKYFTKVVYAGKYAKDKPHPIACRALFDNKMPNGDEIIVIGDGCSDVRLAEFFNAKSIILGTKAKGDYCIQALSQAIDIIKGLQK